MTELITQDQGPAGYPLLRAILGALSQELSALRGTYQTRVIRDFSIGDDFLYLESTYGFPEEGELYVDGHLIRYFLVAENYIGEFKTSAELIAKGAVATLNDASSMGTLKVAHDSMLVGLSGGPMLDIIGNNHAVPRYYGVSDDQYREIIRTLAYMAGKGTDDSIEQFLDVVLDHETLCGDAEITVLNDGRIAVSTPQNNVAAFGGLLREHNARLDIAYIDTNGELTMRRHRIEDLDDVDGTNEFFYQAILREGKSPEFEPGSAWAETFTNQNANALPVLWRVVPYRVWESPYKRIEREAHVGVHSFAQTPRQSVGNTVLIDVLTPQPSSSVGVGYVAGQMIFESHHAGGLVADGRLVKINNNELRLYLTGKTTTHEEIDGLRGYMDAYPRQVLSVRRVIESKVSQARRSALYLPVGPDLCENNAWIKQNDQFYVLLNYSIDPELNAFVTQNRELGNINHIRVDFGEVERPKVTDIHTSGRDLNSGGQIGVTGGVATAQLLPSINTRNPSFFPPVVIITRAVFPAVDGKILEVNLLTEFGTSFTQRLELPNGIDFNNLSASLVDVNAASPEYLLNFFYSSGYQVIDGVVFGLRLFSHAIMSSNDIRI